MQKPLLILGASARAAAMSASRAGFSPIAADLFADMDLVALCHATRVSKYPEELESAALAAPLGPFIYTGGLENHAELIDRIARRRELLGNNGTVLREVRNPQTVMECLRSEGIHCPEIRLEHELPSGGQWLKKLFHGSGGSKVRLYNEQPDSRAASEARNHSGVESSHVYYYQQFISGPSYSAVYVGNGSRATMIGLTQQLVGIDWLGAPRFAYCGSIGPILVSLLLRQQLEAVGDCVACSFKLFGLFGVDMIIRDEEVWPVEVNPRYTASVEVLEAAMSLRAISLHTTACREQAIPTTISKPNSSLLFGKGIRYANADIVITEQTADLVRGFNDASDWPVFADLPFPGTVVKTGSPIATAFGRGNSSNDVLNQMQSLWHSFEETVDRRASLLEY